MKDDMAQKRMTRGDRVRDRAVESCGVVPPGQLELSTCARAQVRTPQGSDSLRAPWTELLTL